MLNLLYDYIQRSLPEDGRLHTSAGLAKKVSPEGRLLPFYGNTLVFLLPEGVRSPWRNWRRRWGKIPSLTA